MSNHTKLKHQGITYLLGIEGSLAYDLSAQAEDFSVKREVNQEVYDWMMQHDVEYNNKGQRIFIYNNIRYVDIGIVHHYKKKKDEDNSK